MINLLPYETKRQIKAARTNVILVRFLILTAISALLLAAIAGSVYVVLDRSRTSARTATEANEKRESSYLTVQAEAATFRENLNTTNTILSQSVSYSNVMISIAHVLPAGVVIDSLNLSAATIGTPITLQAHAKSNAAALLLKQNFTSSPLFSNVSLQSLTNSATSDTTGYPIAVTLSLTINKTAAL